MINLLKNILNNKSTGKEDEDTKNLELLSGLMIEAAYSDGQIDDNELNKIKNCTNLANNLKIEVHAGHGLDYKTTKLLTKIKNIEEFNIGHFLIGESIFEGLTKTIKRFRKIIL